MMKSKGRSRHLYFPAGYDEKIDRLMGMMQRQGHDLMNKNLGILSDSLLIQKLIDEKIEQLEKIEQQ